MHYQRLPGDAAQARAFDWGRLGAATPQGRGRRSGRWSSRGIATVLAAGMIAVVTLSPERRAEPSPARKLATLGDAELWMRRLDLTVLALTEKHSPYLEVGLRRLIALSLERGGGPSADAMLGSGIYLLDHWKREDHVRDLPPMPPGSFPAARLIAEALGD